ncbi:MAG TPA: DUF1684 domain-containing protein [Melioribacteraceae bacterium]|nr:DUF1684 domain-containing protein [Melioribacteraceae bacterium]
MKTNTIIYIGLFIVVVLTATWVIFKMTDDKLSDEEVYINAVEYLRSARDSGKIRNESENSDLPEYFPVNPEFRFKSKFYLVDTPDTVIITKSLGGKEERIKIGYVVINYKGKDYKLYIYSSFAGQKVFYIFFKDLTTGVTTEDTGRYIEIKKLDIDDFLYDIDFNFAYFSSRFNPDSKSILIFDENKLDFAVEAGERIKIKE